MKNLKRTLTILLCYIFVVMMLPVNLITQIVQASTSDVPDYSNVFENGYVRGGVYKNKALLGVAGTPQEFLGYKYYEGGELKGEYDNSQGYYFENSITNFMDLGRNRYYNFNNNEIINIDEIKLKIEDILENDLEVDYIKIIKSTNEEIWYHVSARRNNDSICFFVDENLSNIIEDKIDFKVYADYLDEGLFITIDQEYNYEDGSINYFIRTLTVDGIENTIDANFLNGKGLYKRGTILYAYSNNVLEKYKITKDKLSLISTIDIKGIDLSMDLSGTIDSNNNFWFIAKENNKVGLYKTDNNSVVKKYIINESFLGDLTSLVIYDENNIIISGIGSCKHTVIQTNKKGWVLQNDKWYYYDSTGEKSTGWLNLNGIWYHFDESGTMSTGWKEINGSWYYLNTGGDMATGWLNDNGIWYHFNTSGVMNTGWLNDNGTWYYLNNSGSMTTGWKEIDGTWYYFNTSGIMQTGWLNLEGTWYYLNDSGAMLTGWQQMDGIWYYFDNSGAMATNTIIDGWYIDWSGVAIPQ